MGEEGSENTKLKDENENEATNTKQEKATKKEHLEISQNGPEDTMKINIFLVICIIGVSLGILLEIINAHNRNKDRGVKKYWAWSNEPNENLSNKDGKLKHVYLVLERNGYEMGGKESWDLLWAHAFPFTPLKEQLTELKPHQRVNHFPGTGFITSKVHLATTNSKYIPKSFKLPKEEKELLEYASKNKGALFVEKHNMHRHVYLKNLTEIDVKNGEKFVQEYVTKPFLVDGHKFDIGVYVAITSVNPLRLYWYKGDVLFRYCPKKYYPFDPKDLDKYVIGDDYLPTWKVPSLADPYLNLGLSMKDSFDIYAKSQGKDTAKMWEDVQKAIVDIVLKKEHHIVEALKKYPSPSNFFEMMRFDLIVDEALKVHLLEANMSPNLSSSHFPQNQLLYEQVLYNLFSLVGVSSDVLDIGHSTRSMVSDQKNIAVFGEECSNICKDNCQSMDVCGLCKPCMEGKLRNSLMTAHKEFLHKGDFRRLFPPTLNTKLKDENENEATNTKQEKATKKEHLEISQNGSEDTMKINIFLVICIIGVSLGILLEIINAHNRNKDRGVKKYWAWSNEPNENLSNKDGKLKHVYLVLERNGYEMGGKESWDLLWAHAFPFTPLKEQLTELKPHQRVNHFPGTGFITSKVHLATTNSKYIPKSFKLPKEEKELLEYASKNKGALFVEKHNMHRHVYLKNLTEIDVKNGEKFVQEYVTKPFLVDGHKFDIGVYVAITSVNPLRLYWYKGDVLFRYCPKKYYPFDPKDLDKYVIGDDYLPTWKVPSLAHPYLNLGLSMKDSFDMYAKSQGKDTAKMWEDVQKAIVDIVLKKEHHIVEALKKYPSPSNFFEMMRFDLIVDEALRVYLLEANMSPNLSSSHFPQNQLLYEQVLYNLFSLVGVSSDVLDIGHSTRSMVSDQKNIAVFGEECSNICKDNCQSMDVCGLCKPCMEGKLRNSLLTAHKEFLHKGDFRRLFPPTLKQGSQLQMEEYTELTKYNKLQYMWYQGKCNADVTWCY